MEPIKLILNNFCGHSKSEIDFGNFTSALVVGKIRGDEKFSNGAGKSTIFGAIKYALFSRSDFSTLDKIIRHGCEYCEVVFEFKADNSELYQITRKYSKNSGTDIKLAKKNGEHWENITQRKASEVEKDIAKIIKVNYKTFCNSVLFTQMDLLNGLAVLTAGDRKKSLKEALQLSIYSTFEKATKKKVLDISKEIDTTKTILGTLGDPIKDVLDINNKLTSLESDLNKAISSRDEAKNSLNIENENFASLNSKFELLERQTNENATKQKSLQSESLSLDSIINDYTKKINIIKKDGEILSKDIERINLKIKEFKDNDLTDLNKKLSELTKKIVDKLVLQKNLEIQLNNLNTPLPKGANCKHCRQAISDEHRKICLEQIDDEIKSVDVQKKNIDKEIKELQQKERNYSKQKLLTEISQKEQLTLNNNLELKNKEIEHKKTLYKEYFDSLTKNKLLLDQKKIELDDIKKSQYIKNIDEFLNIKTSISTSKDKILNLQKEIDDIEKLVSQLSNNKAILINKREERNNDIGKILSIKNNITNLEQKFMLHQEVARAFGPAGIPALITHTILDDLQIETNNFLTQLKPGLQAQFSIIKDRTDGDQEDTLEIDYILDGHNLEYAQLSGAQKLIASLCLKLGLSSVIKKRLGTDIKFLLIDEADQYLDDGLLEAFEDAIKKLQKDYKILVITHREKLKESFSHAILVEQDENKISTAKVVNVW